MIAVRFSRAAPGADTACILPVTQGATMPRMVAAAARAARFDGAAGSVLDLPGAPRPEPDTPAPVRFLPAFDNAVLGYHDRSRIIDDAHRNLSVAGARFVLVDGRVAATWTVDGGVVVVTPLRAFTRAERAAAAEEGAALASFLSEGDNQGVRVIAR